MFVASRIEELLNNQKGLSKKDFCKEIGISVQGLDNILKGTEPGVTKIERIADFFKVRMDYFFDRNIELSDSKLSITGNGNKIQHGDGNIMIETQAKEIEHLQQLLAEKERTIQILLNQKNDRYGKY